MFAQCMHTRAQSASRHLALKKKLHHDFSANQVDVYALNARDLTKAWVAIYLDRGWSHSQISGKFRELLGDRTLEFTQNGIEIVDEYGATAISIAVDAKVLMALGTDMKKSGNVLGAYHTAVHNGRQYIIFKGNHRLRTTVRGTRYRITNPTIVKLGIGSEGLKAGAKGGVYIGLFVSVTVNSLAWIFDESFGWRDFLNNIAEDVVKLALAGIAAYFAGKAAAALTGYALISFGFGTFVGLYTGSKMNDVGSEDLEPFVDRIVQSYDQTVRIASEPKAYLRYGLRRAEDALICTVSTTGTIAIEVATQSVQNRIDQLMRRILPVQLR